MIDDTLEGVGAGHAFGEQLGVVRDLPVGAGAAGDDDAGMLDLGDTTERLGSIPHDMECQGCLGTKEVTIKVMEPDSEGRKHPIDKTVPCGFCRGTGLIKVIPDLEHQKVALEIGGILKKGQGIQVGVQVNTGGALVTPDDMKDFRGASDKLLYPARDRGSSEIVDAEVVDE